MATTAEYGLGPFTYPRGWFMIADANELKDAVLPLRFFGQELALYRGESGQPVLLDAICPHMGTNMARNTTSYVVLDGQVQGNSIRCPYHGWRYGADGKCNDIPYHEGPIPGTAKVKTWRVEERYGCLWTWHDPEDAEPDYDIPAIPEWDDPGLGPLENRPVGANSIHTPRKSSTTWRTPPISGRFMVPHWSISKTKSATI